MYLIDTNIAIYLRDVEPAITARIEQLPARPRISLMTWIELEGGIGADTRAAVQRRKLLDILLKSLTVEPLDAPVVETYRHIVSACGFSRSRLIDRLIAATAIVHDLTLITINADDFRDIPGLRLETWPAPQ